MCSYLTQDIELRVVQHYVGPDSQTVVREHCDCLEAGAKLPSYVLEDAEMTELCVRARGDEDWSQDVQLERRDKGSSSSVVQVWRHMTRHDLSECDSQKNTDRCTHCAHYCFQLAVHPHTHTHVESWWLDHQPWPDPLLLGGHSGRASTLLLTVRK